MPVGIQRLNAKKSQPNPRIIFIKPLKGPDEAIALDFLERIAAQCLPIMKEHTLSVMTLEEYEPNREFVGRNFNAGEVVQLVLKSPSTGRWLPFIYVQMVMMHELAHCKQMNHSKAFWAVRNKYAEQMRVLWSRSYTGEGLWGRGALLSTGEFERNTVRPDEVLPEHTCGGTYRSRRRKRGKQQLSYQEQKARRILKKFGPNGQALGDDEHVKAQLEKGRRTQAKPRVAGSQRGRELRAAAALARFEQQAKASKTDEERQTEPPKAEEIDSDETASGSDSETASDTEQEPAAVDVNGQRLVDQKGRNLVKVCEDENLDDDGDAQNEMRELLQSSLPQPQPPPRKPIDSCFPAHESEASTARSPDGAGSPESRTKSNIQPIAKVASPVIVDLDSDPDDAVCAIPAPTTKGTTCALCSFVNEGDAATCMVCSHVLDASRVPGAWKCGSAVCKGSQYLNAGDSGVCGVCGERKG
ncbi:WLM domain-containing protein [Microdochium trichocladiopsis]|uniref:WLM domain-containing protein n=1 Tax=Microdochium trichocladiopsis TaxID=1682393 RepID=A0A9P8Y8K0_9PEZI|nr:WLM domain-containing protein [Microdochium trichocladiopsis]KAH7034954.1 WLM domain-containing protein [Microdochium trichocladiopsis]